LGNFAVEHGQELVLMLEEEQVWPTVLERCTDVEGTVQVRVNALRLVVVLLGECRQVAALRCRPVVPKLIVAMQTR
jgi:hypothetical protein